MTRKLKAYVAYTFMLGGPARISVRDLLGMRTHHNQVDVYVMAPTKKAAAETLSAVAGRCTPREISLAEGDTGRALAESGALEPGMAYVTAMNMLGSIVRLEPSADGVLVSPHGKMVRRLVWEP